MKKNKSINKKKDSFFFFYLFSLIIGQLNILILKNNP